METKATSEDGTNIFLTPRDKSTLDGNRYIVLFWSRDPFVHAQSDSCNHEVHAPNDFKITLEEEQILTTYVAKFGSEKMQNCFSRHPPRCGRDLLFMVSSWWDQFIFSCNVTMHFFTTVLLFSMADSLAQPTRRRMPRVLVWQSLTCFASGGVWIYQSDADNYET